MTPYHSKKNSRAARLPKALALVSQHLIGTYNNVELKRPDRGVYKCGQRRLKYNGTSKHAIKCKASSILGQSTDSPWITVRLQNAAARKGKGLTVVLRRLEISVKYEAGAHACVKEHRSISGPHRNLKPNESGC